MIDLLSSPSPPPVVHKSKLVSKGTSTTASALSNGNSAAGYGFPENKSMIGRDNDGWFCLSDNSDRDIRLPAPAVQKSVRDDEQKGITGWNLKTLEERNLSNSAAPILKRIPPVEEVPAKGKGKVMGDKDPFFLSDDFDTTVDRNETFGSAVEPVAKRRKITPEHASIVETNSSTVKGKGIQRPVSDVTTNSRIGTMGRAKVAGLRRPKTRILEDDPILFSSSPDTFKIARDRKEKMMRVREADLDDYDDDPFAAYDPTHKSSFMTQSEDEDISRPSSDLDLPDIGKISARVSYSKNRSFTRNNSKKTLAAYNSEKTAIQKKTDKSRKAQEKLDAKEAEKERKRAAKEAKAREKQAAADLAKVNALRIDKKVSSPEMIVDLPVDLEERLSTQIRQFLGPLDVECEEWSNLIPNVIKWRRKVEAIFNEETGHWEPIPKQITAEKHVMCIMTAKEFVNLTMGEEGRDLDAHVLRMKARFDDCEIIYLIEGLTAWMRKNKNVRNRQFTEAVRSQMASQIKTGVSATQRPTKKMKQPEYVDEDMVEDALLRLQVVHGALLHHTAATVETAEWVVVFTQHISTIPYR